MGGEDKSFGLVTTEGLILQEFKHSEFATVHAGLSPCGSWVSICGGMAIGHLYNIKVKNNGSFVEMKKALQLRGHKKTCRSINFTPDCTKVLTTSDDGTIQLFNIDVRWYDGQDPQLLCKFTLGECLTNG